MTEKNNPIDWEYGIARVGSKKASEEILLLFLKNLPQDFSLLQDAKENNFEEFKRLIHKMNGAVSYCPLPNLKKTLQELDANLKNNADIEVIFSNFEQQIYQLIQLDL